MTMNRIFCPKWQILSYLAAGIERKVAGHGCLTFDARLKVNRHGMYHIVHNPMCFGNYKCLSCQHAFDVGTTQLFPPAESWLINSNMRRNGHMQGGSFEGQIMFNDKHSSIYCKSSGSCFVYYLSNGFFSHTRHIQPRDAFRPIACEWTKIFDGL